MAKVSIFKKKRIRDYAAKEELWRLYQEAFASALQDSPVRQAFGNEEFLKALGSHRVVKFILYEDDKPVGIFMITAHAERVYWVNTQYFAHHHPREYEQQSIFYVDGVAIHPSVQRRGLAHKLAAAVGQYVLKHQGMLVFDCSLEVEPTLLAMLRGNAGVGHLKKIGGQSFYAVMA